MDNEKIAGELVKIAKSLLDDIPGFMSHVEKTYPLAFRMLRDMRQDATAVGINRVVRDIKDKIRIRVDELAEMKEAEEQLLSVVYDWNMAAWKNRKRNM